MRPNNEEITKSYCSHILVFFGWDSLSDMCRLRCWSPARFVAYTIYISPTMFVAYDVCRLRCISPTMFVVYDVCRLRCLSPTMYLADDVCRLRCLSSTMFVAYDVSRRRCLSSTMYLADDVCRLQCLSPFMLVALEVCFTSDDCCLQCLFRLNVCRRLWVRFECSPPMFANFRSLSLCHFHIDS